MPDWQDDDVVVVCEKNSMRVEASWCAKSTGAQEISPPRFLCRSPQQYCTDWKAHGYDEVEAVEGRESVLKVESDFLLMIGRGYCESWLKAQSVVKRYGEIISVRRKAGARAQEWLSCFYRWTTDGEPQSARFDIVMKASTSLQPILTTIVYRLFQMS